MGRFEYASRILNDVIKNNLSFRTASKVALKKEENEQIKNEVSAVVGCALRHYYVFKELAVRKYGEISDEAFNILSLGLANHIFAKKFDEVSFNKYVESESKLEGVVEFINSFNDPKALIPEDIEYGSKKFNALRYNLPMWIVNLWEKNCGPFLAKKQFRALSSKNLNSALRINTYSISDADFFNKYNDLVASDIEHVALAKDEKTNLKGHQAYRHGDAFMYPLGYKLMCEDLDIDPIRGLAIYNGCSNHILKELYAILGPFFKADVLCNNQSTLVEAENIKKRYHLEGLSLYECPHTAMLTCISKPVHTMFVCPENSSFQTLIDSPEYFLRCHQEDLDRFIQIEKESILEASKQVEDGGDLVYFVPTLCKNETKRVVRAFLAENKNFTLVNEKQLFTFDPYKSILYFAILRKEESHD